MGNGSDLSERLERKAAELAVDSKALEVPYADEVVVNVVYGAEIAAEKAADEWGMGREAHEVTLNGRDGYMPGEDHDAYVEAYNERAEGAVTSEAAVGQKAEFSEGDAVRWSWDGEPVHGRVAKVQDEATVSGNKITGDDDEKVYVIDEWDDRVGGFRRSNVAKPESSLNESGKDLPDRTDEAYVDGEAWESLTEVVSESDWSPIELNYMSEELGVLQKSAPGEWIFPDDDPRVFRSNIPNRYVGEVDPSWFAPDGDMLRAARSVKRDLEEPSGTLAELIVSHGDHGQPLAIDQWAAIDGADDMPKTIEREADAVMSYVRGVDDEVEVTMKGAVATQQRVSPSSMTEAGTNKVDVSSLDGELREAVEADEFYVYGKASIEQWDDDDPPTWIEMDALEGALDRYFGSETAPGIISRGHQDIPVGRPVREFEFEADTTLEVDGDQFEFEAGDTATTHVEDADGDGRPELWLAAEIDGETQMGKKTRALAAQGDLNGFSVTVHRNDDEMTHEGRRVTECDLYAVTIGTDEQIKNKGSEFDVASFKSAVEAKIAGVAR